MDCVLVCGVIGQIHVLERTQRILKDCLKLYHPVQMVELLDVFDSQLIQYYYISFQRVENHQILLYLANVATH